WSGRGYPQPFGKVGAGATASQRAYFSVSSMVVHLCASIGSDAAANFFEKRDIIRSSAPRETPKVDAVTRVTPSTRFRGSTPRGDLRSSVVARSVGALVCRTSSGCDIVDFDKAVVSTVIARPGRSLTGET